MQMVNSAEEGGDYLEWGSTVVVVGGGGRWRWQRRRYPSFSPVSSVSLLSPPLLCFSVIFSSSPLSLRGCQRRLEMAVSAAVRWCAVAVEGKRSGSCGCSSSLFCVPPSVYNVLLSLPWLCCWQLTVLVAIGELGGSCLASGSPSLLSVVLYFWSSLFLLSVFKIFFPTPGLFSFSIRFRFFPLCHCPSLFLQNFAPSGFLFSFSSPPPFCVSANPLQL